MIPLCIPNLSGKEVEYTTQAIESGWVNEGDFVLKFEEMVARETGKDWCIAVQTGTAALHLAMSLDFQDFFFIPSMTFIAAANVCEYLGAKPLFNDITDPWIPEFSMINNVRDMAGGLTAVKNLDGGLTCISFNSNKIITTGQGGAIVGDNKTIEMKLRHLASTAKIGNYIHDKVGFNYRMPNINAAIGCAQMEQLHEFQMEKDQIIENYRAAGLRMVGSCWMAIWETPNRDKKIFELVNAGISAKAFWTPIHLQEPYKDCPRGDLTRTEELWNKLIMLPCSTSLTDEDQNKVIEKCLSLQAEDQTQAP